MSDTIVAYEDENVAPEGYDPKIRRTCLFRASQPDTAYNPPRRYYLAIVPNGASKTWISDDNAEKLLATWQRS